MQGCPGVGMGREGCGQHLGDVPGPTGLSPGPPGHGTPQRGCRAGVTPEQPQLVPCLPPTKRSIKMLIECQS